MVLKNLFSKAQAQAQNQNRPADSRPEGDISIDYMPPKEKKGNSDKLGDFVDYEEIKWDHLICLNPICDIKTILSKFGDSLILHKL